MSYFVPYIPPTYSYEDDERCVRCYSKLSITEKYNSYCSICKKKIDKINKVDIFKFKTNKDGSIFWRIK